MCADCGKQLSAEPPRHVREADVSASWPWPLGSWWRRIGSWLIDSGICVAPAWVLPNLTPPDLAGLGLGVAAALTLGNVGFMAISSATVGQRAVGLSVVNYDGTRIRWTKVPIRFASYLLFGWGIDLAALSSSGRRSFTDLICKTITISGRPVPVTELSDWSMCGHCDRPTPDTAAICPHCRTRFAEAGERETS